MADGVERLWLDALGRLVERAAHEIKNPLNGAVLGVEVLRVRSRRSDLAAAALAPFAESVAEELARGVALIEALLALARPPRTPIDLSEAMGPLVELGGTRSGADDGGVRIALTRRRNVASLTDADPCTVRLVLLSTLEAALATASELRCEVGAPEHGTVTVTFRGTLQHLELPRAVREAADAARIGVVEEQDGWALCFPAAAGERS